MQKIFIITIYLTPSKKRSHFHPTKNDHTFYPKQRSPFILTNNDRLFTPQTMIAPHPIPNPIALIPSQNAIALITDRIITNIARITSNNNPIIAQAIAFPITIAQSIKVISQK